MSQLNLAVINAYTFTLAFALGGNYNAESRHRVILSANLSL